MRILNLLAVAATALALIGCGEDKSGPVANAEVNEPGNGAILDSVIAGDHRSDEERARDQFRNPKETLTFMGLEPGMTVIEVWPGGGWYTQIIAPYLKEGGGKYVAAGFSPEGASERTLASLAAFERAYVQETETYGDVEMTVLGAGGAIGPEGAADMVLTFRNVHNWQSRGTAEKNFAEFYAALKPGGVLGVVEHRADGNNLPRDGSSGYVYTDDVIALAEAAGFEFDQASEINANTADTKDHPFGVWTLPPVGRSSATRGVEDPNFDHEPFAAIGESDRMTLRFRKSIAADGALLE